MRKVVLLLVASAILSVLTRVLLGVSLVGLFCLSEGRQNCNLNGLWGFVGDLLFWFGMIAFLGYYFATGKLSRSIHAPGNIRDFFKLMR